MKNLNIEKIQNYKNITKALLEKTSTIAQFIENICDENGINTLLNGKYVMRSYSSSSCQYTDLCLINDSSQHFTKVCISCDFVNSNNKECIRNGDLKAWYYSPTRDNIKEFIYDIPAIFADIESQMSCDNDLLNNILNAIQGSI